MGIAGIQSKRKIMYVKEAAAREIEMLDPALHRRCVTHNSDRNSGSIDDLFNVPDKALMCYANAVKNYTDAKEEDSIAENYYAAGELMYDLKNPAKAKILLKKALSHADPYKDARLVNKINDLIEEIGG